MMLALCFFQPNTDMYTIQVNGETAVVEDRWASDNEKPELDLSQDVISSSINIEDDVTSVSFTRALVTGDVYDRDVIGCHYFLFAVGPLNLDTGDISYNNESMTHSSQKICISACGR